MFYNQQPSEYIRTLYRTIPHMNVQFLHGMRLDNSYIYYEIFNLHQLDVGRAKFTHINEYIHKATNRNTTKCNTKGIVEQER